MKPGRAAAPPPDGASAEPPAPPFARRHAGKLIASLGVAALFAWLLHTGGLPVQPQGSSFSRVKWWTVGAYVGLSSLVLLLRAGRWHFLLAPICRVPFRKILAVSLIGFAAMALLPLRTGEAVRPLLIRKKGHLSGWAATGTIAAERIIDGLVMSVMLLVGLALSTPLSPLPDHIGNLPVSPAIVPRGAHAALALFGVAFSVMGVFYAQRAWARRMTERIVGFVSPRAAAWLADRVEHVADGLRFLPNLRFSAPFILTTVVYWLLTAAGASLLAWGSGFDDFTFVEGCVAIGVVALGILVPNAPGFFGAYQLSLYAALSLFFPSDMVVGPGGAFVLLIYCSQLLVTIVGAGIGMLLERTSPREPLSAELDTANLPAGTTS